VFFSLLAALGGTLAMDTIFGALTGNGGALIGIGFLGAASFVLFVAACQAVVGLPGTALAALAFIFTGNAISGGSVPVAFLPAVFRQIAPWLPNNAIVRGIRDVIYYHGTDLGHPLLVLGLWPAVALVVLIAVDAIHLVARRDTAHPAAEIYSTSALVHLKRRFGHGPEVAAPAPTPTPTPVPTPTPAHTSHVDPAAVPANSGVPRVPVLDLPVLDQVTVQAKRVVITAGEVSVELEPGESGAD
jgi:hypothetical protein